jgi:hypothetical protein
MAMTRRELLELTALALGAVACGGGGSSGASSAPVSCIDNGTSASIYANHGHVLTVTKADVIAGVEKVYNIQGSATHAHLVTITAALFTQLQANMAADTTSTLADLHDHAIVVSCV